MENRVVVTGIARNGAHISVIARMSQFVGEDDKTVVVPEYGVKTSKTEIWVAEGMEGLKRSVKIARTLFNNPSFI